ALADAQRAMRIIRKNSKKWEINSKKIGVLGFSAGGHLASTLSTHHDQGIRRSNLEIEKFASRPDFSILIYPVVTMKQPYVHMGSRKSLIGKVPSNEIVEYFSNEMQVKADTPPAILIHSDNDLGVLVENSVNYYLALRKHKIPAALHVWEDGGHGYGLAKGKGSIKDWPNICQNWMIQRKLIN
ncbi:alpha/beta hydrolase, partial [Bacteroidota bacterium]|nr:alpha/beta hydrolase [Bacteroidota bacterium]